MDVDNAGDLRYSCGSLPFIVDWQSSYVPSWAFLGTRAREKAMARAEVSAGKPLLELRNDPLVSLDRPRVDLADPGELGIHSAVPVAGGDDDLPSYVSR